MGRNVFVFPTHPGFEAEFCQIHFLPKRRIKDFLQSLKSKFNLESDEFSGTGQDVVGFNPCFLKGGQSPYHGLGLEMHEPGPDMNWGFFSLWHCQRRDQRFSYPCFLMPEV